MIATALGWGDVASIALAVGLAFLFGYTLTSIPLLRSGLAFTAVVPIALAADTISIAIMEVIDNAAMILVPGSLNRKRLRERAVLKRERRDSNPRPPA